MYRRVRDLREDKDLNQTEIANELNISQTTYSRYESGILDIPSNTLKKIALFHNVSVDYLIDITDEKLPYPRNHKK